jgi:CRISPR type III-B/RAMP module-associated protein Cmr5
VLGLESISPDPVKAALEAVSRFSKAFSQSQECKDSSADGVTRRLREFPQLMLQVGLVPALTFLLSKVNEKDDKEAYSETVKTVLGEEAESSKLCKKASGEGQGYAHSLAMLMVFAAKHSGCSVDEIREVDGRMVECLEKIEDKGVVVEKLVLLYANELKKLMTALYPAK